MRGLTTRGLVLSVFVSMLSVTVRSASAQCSVSAIAAGETFSLALRDDGTTWRWGARPGFSPFDDGFDALPASLPELTGASLLAAGRRHALAIAADGTAWAWGDNRAGQTGVRPGGGPIAWPRPVPDLAGVVDLAGGQDHSLAVLPGGSVLAWGANGALQLGRTGLGSEVPTAVAGIDDAQRVFAGDLFSLVLLGDGTLRSWGDGFHGELGHGARDQRSSPVEVTGLSGVVDAAAGASHALAVTGDGRVWSWGANWRGELGHLPAGIHSEVAREVPGLPAATAVAAGFSYSAALSSDGSVWVWGWNGHGVLGSLEPAATGVPTAIDGIRGAVALAAGDEHLLVRHADGRVSAWGRNREGQLAAWPDDFRAQPTAVPGLASVISVTASREDQSLALLSDGSLRAWGDGSTGELGDGTLARASLVPRVVPGVSAVASMDAGLGHALALLSDGSVWAWGLNDAGQLGLGLPVPVVEPISVPVLSGSVQVVCGWGHSLVLRDDGRVSSFGDNGFGELGHGSREGSLDPRIVSGLSGVTEIAAGARHSLALLGDGTVRGWGFNLDGRVGTGDRDDALSPRPVSGLAGVRTLSAGLRHSLAVDADGVAWSWGSNASGQLGRPGLSPQATPMAVSLPGRATSVAAGGGHSLALLETGEVWAWGRHGLLDLGEGPEPVRVPGLLGATGIAAGLDHSIVLLSDGSLVAWGANEDGQLGLGSGSWSAERIDTGFAGPAPTLGAVLRVAKSPPSPGRIVLSWDLAHQAVSYRVYQELTPDFDDPTLIGSVPDGALEILPPTSGLLFFRVRAVDCAGNEGG